jgi:hypothetical protein
MEAVIQIAAGRRNECMVFPDVPISDPTHVAFVAAVDPPAETTASDVYAALLARFSRLAASVGASGPNPCGLARLDGCRARRQPACHSLLVIACGPGMMGPQLTRDAIAWLGRPSSAVLAILAPGGSASTCLPPQLRRINAVNATFGTGSLADAVEVAANIRDRQLFISYRRKEAQDIADQLFDAFSHSGWRVYLDRFTGTPSRQFPREIVEELTQKGVVLVIESRDIALSSWTLAEVAAARLLSLGLLAVSLPGSPTLRGIAVRKGLQPHEIVPGATPSLAAGVPMEVVRFVGEAYMEQSHFRRAVMTARLRLALAGEGLSMKPASWGGWHVQSTRYVAHLAPRPAGLNETRRGLESAATPQKAVVIGPYRLQPPARINDVERVAARLGIALRSEWRMTDLARDMRHGRIP